MRKAARDDLILKLAEAAESIEWDEPTYKCFRCKDIGYETRHDERQLFWAKPCVCDKGKEIQRGERVWAAKEAMQAAERQAERRKRDAYFDDEVPGPTDDDNVLPF